MCGIAGLVDLRRVGNADALTARARAMGDALAHRGPDSDGIHVEAECGLAFAHRRLAIVDLTPSGAQPMTSADGRFVICYNGEVYNAEDLRKEADLAGVVWRGHSDTEVILELAARRGFEAVVPLLNGMFAIAMWDRMARVLHLVRDRIGIKPLFFRADDKSLIFGSELKALFAAQDAPFQINPASVASFLRYSYVPAPHSIFRGVSKLMPGQIASFSLASGGLSQPRLSTYWDLTSVAHAGVAAPLDISDEEAVAQLTALLQDAVARQMMGDVPLGAFLSGGVDSSTVVALMVAAKQGPVRTYSIGFGERGFDESVHAAAVARHLGTRHTELTARAQDALDLVPQLSQFYDEPFGDSSQIPTQLVSKLTRAHVTVALSGDGGDELFGGYNRYRLAEMLAARLSSVPVAMRRAMSATIGVVPVPLMNAVGDWLPPAWRVPQAGDKARKLADVLPLDEEGIYRHLVSQNPQPGRLMPGVAEHAGLAWGGPQVGPLPSLLDKMQYLDTVTYLPDDILQKVDRASMSVALEARPPLLDHRVVEFAWRLPRRFKIRNGETKWVLRRVLDQFVPRRLIERPKMGFGIPLGDWLRGPLRDWAEDLLDPRHLSGHLLDPMAVQALWQEHLTHRNRAYALWNILMFEAWHRHWRAKVA